MSGEQKASAGASATTEDYPVNRFRHALEEGQSWPVALLKAVASWTGAKETFKGRVLNYFIGGEAFDWLLLAQRLCDVADDLIPANDKEDLLFLGRLPSEFDASSFKDLIGVDKYRGHLNYFYGVTVEEALQLAAEREVEKRHMSNGNRYQQDFSEEAFVRVYRAPKASLIEAFRKDLGYPARDEMELGELKELTYWLFRYRLRTSDKAKIASDTRKGLMQLHHMEMALGVGVRRYIDQSEIGVPQT